MDVSTVNLLVSQQAISLQWLQVKYIRFFGILNIVKRDITLPQAGHLTIISSF
jgi:hypothetical protein